MADAKVILYCLSNDAAVQDLLWGSGHLLKSVHARPDRAGLDHRPPVHQPGRAAAYAAQGVKFLDTPVFGSKNEAANGGLWIVVGGDPALYEQMLPILEPISQTTHYMGENGKGSAMKLVGNLVVAFQLEAIGEAMILATKAGLNAHDVLGVLHVTDFKSPIFDGVGGALVQRNFDTFFALKLMLKDANLIARFAQDLDAPLPAGCHSREHQGRCEQGLGRQERLGVHQAPGRRGGGADTRVDRSLRNPIESNHRTPTHGRLAVECGRPCVGVLFVGGYRFAASCGIIDSVVVARVAVVL